MPKHNYSIDLLRGIAAFGIVGCHLMLYPKTGWSAAMTALCDMFVGLFAALSGYWMGIKNLDKTGVNRNICVYVVKRARRIIPTYLVWSVAYICFGLCFDLIVRKGLPSKWFSSGFWFDALFLGGASCHLWFLICLFYSQIVLHVFTFVKRNVCWLVYIVIGFALIVVSAYSSAERWWTFYPLRLFAFLVTGYGVAGLPLKVRRPILLLGLFVLCLIMHYGMGSSVPRFIRDWLVAIPLLALSANASIADKLNSIAGVLGKTSMGVFLVHPVFAAGFGILFKKFFASPYGIVPWALDWAVCWGCSFAGALILLRIPVARKFAS